MQYTNLPNTCLALGCATFTTVMGQCSSAITCTGYVSPNPPCGSLMHQEIYECVPAAEGAPCGQISFGNPAPDTAGFPAVVPQGCH